MHLTIMKHIKHFQHKNRLSSKPLILSSKHMLKGTDSILFTFVEESADKVVLQERNPVEVALNYVELTLSIVLDLVEMIENGFIFGYESVD